MEQGFSSIYIWVIQSTKKIDLKFVMAHSDEHQGLPIFGHGLVMTLLQPRPIGFKLLRLGGLSETNIATNNFYLVFCQCV